MNRRTTLPAVADWRQASMSYGDGIHTLGQLSSPIGLMATRSEKPPAVG